MERAKIAKAIQAVMKSVKGMEKNSRVGGTSSSAYNGTKDQDVKEVFNTALEENGLCIMPIDIQEETIVERWEEVDKWSKSTPKDMKSKQSIFTKVKVKYLLLHESGESIELAGYGHGVDPQDKGAGKATTYALKNCLLYTFLTPVGKIDDTETTHSNDIATPQPAITKPAIKDWLTEENFNKALKSDELGVTTTLDIYDGLNGKGMKKEYKDKLNEALTFFKQ
tara:strand:+ start:1311 stop:1982 length:672 start_codon:yes stop_codon:yes gene_type:complete